MSFSTTSKCFLNASMDGDSTTFLGNPFQQLTTLSEKKFLLMSCPHTFPLTEMSLLWRVSDLSCKGLGLKWYLPEWALVAERCLFSRKLILDIPGTGLECSSWVFVSDYCTHCLNFPQPTV